MFVQVRHRDSGKTYLLPVSQVVVANNDGQPVSLAYERDGLIVCSDATQQDFAGIVKDLRIADLKIDG
mgnify:CR=1 FL=1